MPCLFFCNIFSLNIFSIYFRLFSIYKSKHLSQEYELNPLALLFRVSFLISIYIQRITCVEKCDPVFFHIQIFFVPCEVLCSSVSMFGNSSVITLTWRQSSHQSNSPARVARVPVSPHSLRPVGQWFRRLMSSSGSLSPSPSITSPPRYKNTIIQAWVNNLAKAKVSSVRAS